MKASHQISKRTRNGNPFTVATIDGWLVGPTRRPTNSSSHETGTIHDDRTARELGFRSGTIAGSIHMEQFVPLCEYAFGRDWSRSGSLSLYFLNPSIDDEPVEALIGSRETVVGGCRRRDAVMNSAAGMTILEGSASASAFDTASAVRERLRQRRAMRAAGSRILASVPESFSAIGLPTTVPQTDIDARLSIITERRPEFTDATIFGHTVAPLSAAIHAMRVFENQLPRIGGEFIGLFGAIDWQYLNGPVFADYPYEVDGRVVAIGDSPKTEMLWYECTLRDPSTSQDIARMLMLSRLLKATSLLWHEGPVV